MARKNQYEIGIAADTSGLEKAISNGLVDPLEDAADAFDDLEKAANGVDLDKEIDKAQKATGDLGDDLDDARTKLKRLGYAAKDAGDDAKRGMDDAGDGVKELGDEAKQSARETAASFSEVADVLDLVQEVAANAFAGFGPAGMAAGLVAAAGIGLATSAFQAAEEAAEDLRQKANDYANDARDAGVTTGTWLAGSQQVLDRIRELQDVKDNGLRLWFMDDPDDLEKWTSGLKRMGRSASDVEKVLSMSSTGAVKDYRREMAKSSRAIYDQIDALIERNKADPVDGYLDKVNALNDQYKASKDVLAQLDKEIDLREKSASASEVQRQAGVDAALERAQAEEDMASRIQSAQDAVVDSTLSAFDSMRTAAYEKATADDAAFNTDKWLEYVEKGRAAAEEYKANIAAMKLSPEEWDNFLALPEDARNSIAASYQAAGDDGKQRIRAALSDTGATAGAEATVGFNEAFNPEASVDVAVQVDTSDAEAALDAAAEDRTATIKAKLTGEKSVRAGLTDITRKRTVTIEPRLDTSRINREMAAWRRRQESRPITIRSKVVAVGSWD